MDVPLPLQGYQMHRLANEAGRDVEQGLFYPCEAPSINVMNDSLWNSFKEFNICHSCQFLISFYER